MFLLCTARLYVRWQCERSVLPGAEAGRNSPGRVGCVVCRACGAPVPAPRPDTSAHRSHCERYRRGCWSRQGGHGSRSCASWWQVRLRSVCSPKLGASSARTVRMSLLVKDAVALLLAAFGLIATTRWLLVRCYSPPQPARLARLALAVHTAGRQQRKRTVAVRAPLNATTHLPTPLGVWHALAPSGRCPAPIPTWDWQLLLAAARAERPHERYETMERLRASSSLAYGELVQLVHSYRAKLRDPEFAHILDPSHARCGGRCSSMVRVPPWWCHSCSALACWGWLSGGLTALRTRDEPRSRSGPNGRLPYGRAARPKSPILRASTTTQPLR